MKHRDEQFYEAVKHDPLFAAEGMDLERAQAAIDALAGEVRKFQGEIMRQSLRFRLFFMIYPLTRSVVPLSFLRAFVESERRRRLFLASPTPAAARRLTRGWQAAAQAMQSGVRRYKRLHRFILLREPGLAKKTFHDMAGNTFSMEDINHSLESLVQNAEALVREARERASRSGSSSPRPGRSAPKGAQPTIPLPELYHFMEELEEEKLEEWNLILEKHGPVAYELSHFDGKPTVHQFILYIAENRVTHEPYFGLTLADHFVFLPIGAKANFGRLGSVIFQPLIDRGIRFFAQQLTWFYSMRDQQYIPDILTIIDSKRRPTLDQHLLQAQRSSLFDLLLWRGVDDLRRYTQMTRVRSLSGEYHAYSLGHAFLMQSHPSIYFLPFNESVWRLPEPASFLGSGRTETHQEQYVPISRVAPLLTREELRDTVRAGIIRRQAWKDQGIDLYS